MKKKFTDLSFQNYDLILLGSVILLSIIGIFFIYSSGVSSQGVSLSREYLKQIVWVITGFFLMILFSVLDYRRLKLLALLIYLGSIVLLIITLLFGAVVNGAKSWIGIGSLGIQPSEFAKIAVILFLASYLEDNYKEMGKIRIILFALIIVGIPSILIILQPDLGTAMVMGPIFFSMIFIGGCDYKHIGFLLLTLILTVVFTLFHAWSLYISDTVYNINRIFSEVNFMIVISVSLIIFFTGSLIGYSLFRKKIFYAFGFFSLSLFGGYIMTLAVKKILQGYQLMRLVVFMDPNVAPLGAGWNIIQSVTAVGSGGLWGKGFLKGTQSHYRFLPQQSTDFIFSILAEEIGFVGSLFVFLLFILVLYRMLYIIFTARDRFGALFAAGMAGFLSFHVIENVGMAIGIMPVTGIPLVFLSYGGSSLWTAFIGIGILLSIHQRRYRN